MAYNVPSLEQEVTAFQALGMGLLLQKALPQLSVSALSTRVFTLLYRGSVL